MNLHPLCTLFPRMAGAEFAALVADIQAHGLTQPIVTHGGMILDGGNRYAACLEAGIEPRFVEFDGDSIVSFVLSANLHRRHMTAGQQAAIVAAAQDWATAQKRGRPEKTGNVAGLQTVEKRCEVSGASERTQRMADKVSREQPELAKAVARGEMSLPAAVREVEGKPERAPAPKAVPADELAGLREDNAELRERNAELAKQCEELLAENEALGKVVDAEDRITAALTVAREAREREAILQSRIDGLMNERNANVRHIKVLQRQLGERR